MNLIEKYYNQITRYDLINKFNYHNLNEIPKFEKIILNIGCKTCDLKKLSVSVLALQLITKKKSKLVASKKSNILLKIKKGEPVACKIILTKKCMYEFLVKIIFKIIPNSKYNIVLKEKSINNITLNFKNILIFSELEKNYFIFNNADKLNLTIFTSTTTRQELFFLLNSFNFFCKN